MNMNPMAAKGDVQGKLIYATALQPILESCAFRFVELSKRPSTCFLSI